MIAVFLAALAVPAVSEQINPLGQVIGLLADLSAKVQSEADAEAKAFAEYSEWCDDTKKDKANDIKSLTTQKEKLEAKIAKLAGDIQVADSKIGDLAGAIAGGTQELENATSIRKKEAADFVAGETELLEVIDTLSRATSVLEREMQKNPASFAQVANNGLASVVESLGTVVDAAGFSGSDKQRLLALVQSDDSDSDSDMGAPAAAVYKSKSSGIFDALEDLKDKADAQLSDLRKAEAEAKHSYEMLKQGLEDQLAADNKDLDEQKSSKAADQESKATAEGDLTATVADLKATKEDLASIAETCDQVAETHEATVAGRAEELKVIAEATDVLKAQTGGAVEKTYSFLQLSSTMESHADLARHEVMTLVKKLAKKHHSAALAQLASRIGAAMRYGGSDPFAKVKGLIEDMIAKLQEEAGAEAAEKAFCDEEMGKSEAKKSELDAEIAKLTTKLDQDSSKSTELKEDVKQLQAELAAMAASQLEADNLRKETHADYVEAKADLELGLNGVRKALVMLREYYAADDEAAFVQQPAVPAQYKASGGAASSIIGILEVCESDFATNLAKEETEEATAQEDYEQLTQENKISKAAKDQDVKYKTKEFTALDKAIGQLTADRDTASTELEAVLEYYSKLKERCIAKPETYEARKARREAEIAGLKEAMKILDSEAALVQRSAHRGHHLRQHSA